MPETPATEPGAVVEVGGTVPDGAVGSPKAGFKWGKRLGAAAFMFFLIKGLAWLIVPAAVAVLASR